MNWLIRWLRTAMPKSRIVVMALLPNTEVSVARFNSEDKASARQYGATYLDCNRGINMHNSGISPDGTHLTEKGQQMWLRCLHNAVKRYI